ncbi:MAG: c-type cytochrome [Sulfurimonas sp.]|nr:c-type cytochrome [Sulfurimonas sp.]
MKKVILSLFIFVLFLIDASAKDKGKEIFEKKGCTLCHKKSNDTIGPSLHRISKAYVGKGEDLLNYLKSKGKPIVEPKRALVMNPQLIKIKILSDEDMKSLATYIIIANDT